MTSKTVVFIHGMFVTPACWEAWSGYYRAKGYVCLAPAWPGRDRPIETLRKNHPDPHLGKLTLADVVEHYAAILKKLGEKPIIIGHSMGGLIAQLLLQRGLGAAAIAIDSAPPLGLISTQPSFWKSNWPLINPFVSKFEPYFMPFAHFQYAFVHTLPLEEQQAAYNKYVVPESRQVAQGTLSPTARIDFRKPHAPLLLMAGSDDRIVPAGLNHSNYQRYGGHSSVVAFKEFAGRTHFIIGQKNWEEPAEYGVSWLKTRKV